jgi:WD40 repeat protein
VVAVGVLPNGQLVTGGGRGDGRVLVWDPHRPGGEPAELGRHDGPVRAVGVLPDGRIVTGGDDGRVLAWNPHPPIGEPVELGRTRSVQAMGVLPDGRVVTGDFDRQVLVWDPHRPGAGPAELGRHDRPVVAVGVLADGRVVSGGDDSRVLVWDPAWPGGECARIECSVQHVAVSPPDAAGVCQLIVAHEGYGFSIWMVPPNLNSAAERGVNASARRPASFRRPLRRA